MAAAASSSTATPLPSADLGFWRSTLSVQKNFQTGVLKSKSKGWGSAGAISEPILTRHGNNEGFLAVLPNLGSSLFIGFSTMASNSLTDKGRAHQEDLEFSLRLAADGTLSYQSAAKLQQFYHAQSMEGDTLCVPEKGDAVGMKFTPDRKGIVIIRRTAKMAKEAAAAEGGGGGAGAAAAAAGGSSGGSGGGVLRAGKDYTVLKTVSEIISFPMRLMVVFGATTQFGPVTWLRGKGSEAVAAASSASLKGPPTEAPTTGNGNGGAGGWAMSSSEPSILGAECDEEKKASSSSEQRVVKGRTAADMLPDSGFLGVSSSSGVPLVIKEAKAGSWAAGKVSKVKDGAGGGGGGGGSSWGGGGGGGGSMPMMAEPHLVQKQREERAQAKAAKEEGEAKMRASRALALQPKVVARGARLVPNKAAAAAKAKHQEELARRQLAKASGAEQGAAASGGGIGEGGAEADGDASAASSAPPQEKFVPMSASVKRLIAIVIVSPFTSAAERATLHEIPAVARQKEEEDDEEDDDGAATPTTISLTQLKALQSALDRLMPLNGTSDMDAFAPPPPPPPPPRPQLYPQLPPDTTATATNEDGSGVEAAIASSKRPCFFGPPSECMRPLTLTEPAQQEQQPAAATMPPTQQYDGEYAAAAAAYYTAAASRSTAPLPPLPLAAPSASSTSNNLDGLSLRVGTAAQQQPVVDAATIAAYGGAEAYAAYYAHYYTQQQQQQHGYGASAYYAVQPAAAASSASCSSWQAPPQREHERKRSRSRERDEPRGRRGFRE